MEQVSRTIKSSLKSSLWVYYFGKGCCADEVFNSIGSRYDIERFGVKFQSQPEQADLLIINGLINKKSAPELMQIYNRMKAPKFVLAIGACACRGGLFDHAQASDIPIDVFVPGCPPRPEAIMNGLLAIQEKIDV